MRIGVEHFRTHIAQKIGSQEFASKNKQADLFDCEGRRIGWLAQYRHGSFTVYLSQDYVGERAMSPTTTHTCFMQVRRYLERFVPQGMLEWR